MAVIFGDQNPPNFDDVLFDNANESDFILAGLGNDTIVLFNDVLPGLQDSALGQSGDDTFFVLDAVGDNLLDGGTEINGDTVSYISLNESIVLKAQGIIEKASGGTDFLSDIESIVGSSAAGVVNTIDASDAGSSASIDVNLSTNTLLVNIPGNPLKFEVVNFDNVEGTGSSDTIVGNGNDNVFFGSLGNDTYDGGASGFDTLDYSDLNLQITLKAQGQIVKSNGSTDQLLGNPAPLTPSIDRIVGVSGLRNAIDGRISAPTTTTFKVDLAEEFLDVSVLSQPFEVANFVDVIGTANNDSIQGDGTIIGGLSNVFFGQLGGDTLQAVDETAANPGLKELDILFGGSDQDGYLVGDSLAGDYYLSDDISADPFGNDDFALIFDYELFFDQLNLSGANPYVYQGLPGSGPFGLAGIDVYADFGTLPGNVDAKDDLITRVLFNGPLNLATPPASSSLTALSSGNISSGDSFSKIAPADESLELAQLETTEFAIDTIDEAVKLALGASSRFDKLDRDSFETFTSNNLPKELAASISFSNEFELATDFAIA